jgi:putative oxidoreductase
MEAKRQDLTNSIGLLVLRLGMGGYMVTHGWGKFLNLMQGKFNEQFDPIGLGPHLSLIGAVGAEFVCAILVMIGLATRVAAAPLVFTMIVAAFVAHGSDPWTMGEAARLFSAGEVPYPKSKEPALLFGFAFLALIFTGAGKLSVDGMIWPRVQERRRKKKAAG